MKMFGIGLVYKVTCTVSGRVYIGKTMRCKAKRMSDSAKQRHAREKAVLD